MVNYQRRFHIHITTRRGPDVAAMIKQCQNFKHGFPYIEARISDLQARQRILAPELMMMSRKVMFARSYS